MTANIRGLSSEEVNKSLRLHGDNSIKKEKQKGIIRRFIENLTDPIIRILLVALVLQVVFSLGNINYFEIFGILSAILLSATVSTLSEYRSERAFEGLSSEEGGTVNVLRNGRIIRLDPSGLVIGDVVYLNAGERIAADGELISGRISVDQSALNGESAECEKTVGVDYGWDLSSPHRVFRGSLIIHGSAIMRVGRVGEETYYGMVAKDVQIETRVSPLKHRLRRLAKQISKIGYVVAFIVGISYLFNTIVIDNQFDPERISRFLSDYKGVGAIMLKALTLMITVVVVAAPEGLPMMITVVLSANMKRMLSDNILVKKLVGIETAGSMNILFTDKTGTLTVGRLQCDRIITSNKSIKSLTELKQQGEIYNNLLLSAKYNTDVSLLSGEMIGGNATDRGIYEFFLNETAPMVNILHKESFTSERKSSYVILKNGKKLIKGAAENILVSCKYSLDKDGRRIGFDSSSVKEQLNSAADRGERVIGVAIEEPSDTGLTFVALIVMKDRIRQGIADSVRQVTKAGIQVVMVTGDGKETAVSIAKECGIYRESLGHIAISSKEMERLSDAELSRLIPRIRVVSRALPQDKARLVRLSQEKNMVVGMTGDGINDAPSLKLADVGFAMGGGTDIAKSASDVVILDNSFFAISKTVLYGRTIFKSIRKFITFQLTMNLCACGVSFVGQLIGVDTPITIIQMLWINIIMDTLGGLAFAGEPPLDYYMKERPINRDEGILSVDMLHQIFLSGIYTLALSIFFLASPSVRIAFGSYMPTDRFYTAFYALFVFSGIFNCFSARSSRLWLLSNIGKNKPFIFIMLLISVIQICMIYFGGGIFRCVPLRIAELSFVILLSITVIPFEMLRRLFYKLK